MSDTLILCLILTAYLAPSAIAIFGRAKHSVEILIVNVLFGWTLIGWLLAFVWSVTDAPAAPRSPRSRFR